MRITLSWIQNLLNESILNYRAKMKLEMLAFFYYKQFVKNSVAV